MSEEANAVIELQLITNEYQQKFLNDFLWTHYTYYLAVVKLAKKQIKYLRRNREYKSLLKHQRAWKLASNAPSKEKQKAVKQRLKDIVQGYGLNSSISFNYQAKKIKDTFPVMSVAAQAIAEDVYKGIEKVMYHGAKKLNTKRFSQFTIQSKQWEVQFKFDESKRMFSFNRGKHRFKTAKYTDYDREVLFSDNRKLKYVRLVQKQAKNQYKYAIQITYAGLPPLKQRTTRDSTPLGLDLGPSSIAVYHKDYAVLSILNPFAQADQGRIDTIQHQMAHKQGVNNPDAFETTINGHKRYIKGHKIKKSKRWKKLKRQLQYAYTLKSRHRKLWYEHLSNEFIALSHDIRFEKISVSGWQVGLFGHSIGNHAPSELTGLIKEKLGYFGYEVIEIKTNKAKLSQYHHDIDKYVKHDLSDRIKNIDGHKVQRDLYSAFLATHVESDGYTVGKIDTLDWLHFIGKEAKVVRDFYEFGQQQLSSFGLKELQLA